MKSFFFLSSQQKTFPIFYYKPHFKTRTPSFNVVYQIKFLGSGNLEIISYQTDNFPIKPFSNNTLEGKVDTDYKDLEEFQKDIFNKTTKIIVTVLKAVQSDLRQQ